MLFLSERVHSQLFYDGYSQIALDLINAVKSSKACPPSDRLLHLTCMARKYENKEDDECEDTNETYNHKQTVGGIDLDFETEANLGTPEPGI